VGVAKTERINVNHTTGGGIFILPEKNDVTDADYEVIESEDIPD
jgi:hypothetical protein